MNLPYDLTIDTLLFSKYLELTDAADKIRRQIDKNKSQIATDEVALKNLDYLTNNLLNIMNKEFGEKAIQEMMGKYANI